MSRWIAAVVLLMSGPLTGCTFRPQPYVQGNLTSIKAPSEVGAGEPIRIEAHASYASRYEQPVLSVHLSDSSTIRVNAVADWTEPPGGFGIFAGLPFATEVDLVGSVTCDRPGTYTVTDGKLPGVTVLVR